MSERIKPTDDPIKFYLSLLNPQKSVRHEFVTNSPIKRDYCARLGLNTTDDPWLVHLVDSGEKRHKALVPNADKMVTEYTSMGDYPYTVAGAVMKAGMLVAFPDHLEPKNTYFVTDSNWAVCGPYGETMVLQKPKGPEDVQMIIEFYNRERLEGDIIMRSDTGVAIVEKGDQFPRLLHMSVDVGLLNVDTPRHRKNNPLSLEQIREYMLQNMMYAGGLSTKPALLDGVILPFRRMQVRLSNWSASSPNRVTGSLDDCILRRSLDMRGAPMDEESPLMEFLQCACLGLPHRLML
ncbi:hypothetical protein HY214_04535 [Candidatus Roizmanbacteria bacterium]|nr:hypothetical protein [Candidatus Roizmanbacteria bacterium]